MSKFIFVTGGVMSSLGKGIFSASLGRILLDEGFSVTILKMDPYLNVDAGVQNPFEHGEVFVTEDGAETDLDLGHYERFLNQNLHRMNNVTSGQVYLSVIEKERKGEYLGHTVQIIPHLTGEIRSRITKVAEESKADFVIVEVGGTVGDIEGLPFLEAIREFWAEDPANSIFAHLTYVPYLETTDELKTKPTQHSVGELRKIGIQPTLVVARGIKELPIEQKRKVALFCGVPADHVISLPNLTSVYKVPNYLQEQRVGHLVLSAFGIAPRRAETETPWVRFTWTIDRAKTQRTMAIVGKYVQLNDAYLSLREALHHAAWATGCDLHIDLIDSEEVEKQGIRLLEAGRYDGILVPGGFGKRGIEGMILAAGYARTHNLPYVGICLGMQVASIEFARNVLGITGANSQEFEPGVKDPVIYLMPSQKGVQKLGGTMRLGVYENTIVPGTKVEQAYGASTLSERHRHRYEFNNAYRAAFEEHGMRVAAVYPEEDLVEAVELTDHPFFVGVQFHPELSSKPLQPGPLFVAFLKAMLGHAG
ncbi:MAG: CTP synthase [Candidatus Cryosericum sp.]